MRLERVADDGRANVADVHRLGHVGGRVVDHVRPRLFGRLDAQPIAVQRRADGAGEPLGFDAQVDEAGPGDLRRLAEVVDVELRHDFGRHIARRSAQALAQRHGEVGLVVAEFRILAGPHHGQQLGRIIDQPGQGSAKAGLQFGEDVHGGQKIFLTTKAPREEKDEGGRMKDEG